MSTTGFSVCLTDAPEVVDIKRAYRQLDEWHEAAKQLPEVCGVRAAVINLVCAEKATLARRMAFMDQPRDQSMPTELSNPPVAA